MFGNLIDKSINFLFKKIKNFRKLKMGWLDTLKIDSILRSNIYRYATMASQLLETNDTNNSLTSKNFLID